MSTSSSISRASTPLPFSDVVEQEAPLNQEDASPSFPWAVQIYWKDILLIAGIATAIAGLAIAIFSGMIACAVCFGICVAVLAFGLYHIHKSALWSRLHDALRGLNATHRQLEQTHEGLKQTHEGLQETYENLKATNDALKITNQQLAEQVTTLTLTLQQLNQSAARIQEEVIKFQQENVHLGANASAIDNCLHTLDQELALSQSLSAQIRLQLQEQQWNFSEQLKSLQQLIDDLKTNDSTNEKLNVLLELNREIDGATTQLHQLERQYAQQLAELTVIKEAFEKVKQGFEGQLDVLQENVGDLREEKEGIAAQRRAFQDLFDRFLAIQLPESKSHIPTPTSPSWDPPPHFPKYATAKT